MAKIGNQELTQGWYLTGGLVTAIAFSNTRAAPLILGVLVVALIYQVTNLVEGIPPGGKSTAPTPSTAHAGSQVTPAASFT